MNWTLSKGDPSEGGSADVPCRGGPSGGEGFRIMNPCVPAGDRNADQYIWEQPGGERSKQRENELARHVGVKL